MSVYEEILTLTAVLYDQQDDRLSDVCYAVEQSLQAQLRSSVSLDECHDSFVYAAALMSLSLIKTLDDDKLTGFDAGTLKLSFADRTDQLSAMAKQLIAPWCGEDHFAFCGVRG